jgi:class 3 adenylate cyclase
MESELNEVTRRYTKYIFLDVVQFSNRSAEAQTEIVSRLNEIVRKSLDAAHIKYDNDTILIPTGDGVCVGLVGSDLSYDVHIRVALDILLLLDSTNQTTQNETRRFQIRIGINQNTDILFTDINGRLNLAGAGINLASRIMDKADGMQILVSQAAFHELQPSETYMDKFRSYSASGKHGSSFQVYQYVGDGHPSLNKEIPSAFASRKPEKKKLTEQAAHYIAQAIVHRQDLMRIKASPRSFWEDAAIILLRFLSRDSYELSKVSEFGDAPHTYTWNARTKTFDEQYEYYAAQDTWLRADAEAHTVNAPYDERLDLARYSECFESENDYLPHYAFINKVGVKRLNEEWPEVWSQYELDHYT